MMWFAARSDDTFMVLDNPFYDRKPDAGAVIIALAVKPLEYLKYFFAVLFVKTNPIVCDRDVTILLFR